MRCLYQLAVLVVLLVSVVAVNAIEHHLGENVPDPNKWYLVRNTTDWSLFVINDENFNPDATPELDVYCKARLNNTRLTTGWNEIVLQSSPRVNDGPDHRENYYEYCGYLEGYLTFGEITVFHQIIDTRFISKLPPAVLEFVNFQLDYLQLTIMEQRAASEFWSYASAFMAMMQGIMSGFNARGNELFPDGNFDEMSFRDVFLMNLRQELVDVLRSLPNFADFKDLMDLHAFAFSTAFVKNVGDDVLLGHAGGGEYDTLMQLHRTMQLDTTIIATTYPGCMASDDNWIITSNNLVVMSTRNAYFDTTVAPRFVKATSVPAFLRLMVASASSSNTNEWRITFSINASGTLSSQYVIFDQKLFTPNGDHPEGTLVVVEEMPGLLVAHDQSQKFRISGMWSSANVPVYREIWTASGFAAAEITYGQDFSTSGNPRALMIMRNGSQVSTLNDLKGLLRFNNFAVDPLSIIQGDCFNADKEVPCTPATSPLLALAARGDLVDPAALLPSGPFNQSYLRRAFFGTVDAKVTSAAWLGIGLFDSCVSGPTHFSSDVAAPWIRPLQPFAWSAAAGVPNPAPGMIPPAFNFTWNDFPSVPIDDNADTEPEAPKEIGVGVIVGAFFGCIVGLIVALSLVRMVMPRALIPRDDESNAGGVTMNHEMRATNPGASEYSPLL